MALFYDVRTSKLCCGIQIFLILLIPGNTEVQNPRLVKGLWGLYIFSGAMTDFFL